jgi:phage-related protein
VKPVVWIGPTKDTLSAFPRAAKEDIGHALYVAQQGGKHPAAKPLKGFGGAGVLEIVEDFDGDTYRAIYTVEFEEAIYVLDVYQKKSASGIATPKPVRERIARRHAVAQREHRRWLERRSPPA